MSAECRLILYDKNGNSFTLSKCISFNVQKELYTPYSQMKASFAADGSFNWEIKRINRLYLYINGNSVHYGLAEDTVLTQSGSGSILNIFSRGFTLLLGQNQPQPGINTNVNLKSLIRGTLDSSMVLMEDNTPSVNYIFVKENSTLWDAVVAYSLKANGFYPYIRGNTVCITLSRTQICVMPEKLIEIGEGVNTSNMISAINMKDTDGEYSFHKTNPAAAEFNIEREKYYALDRQWLSDTDTGLSGRINYSNRKSSYSFYSYNGYNGEMLMDKIDGEGSSFNGKRISAIVISGNKNKITTKICCYNDYLSQRKNI